MFDEKELSPQESLQLIQAMIDKAKNSYVANGIGPLFWGVLITFCSLVTYGEMEFNLKLPFDIWWLTTIALLPQIFFAWRSKRQSKFRSHDDVVMNYVWATFFICLVLLSFYSNVQHPIAYGLYLIIYGMPTFITGGIRNFKPMIIGGIVCWICSIISCYTTFKINMLLSAVSAISAWLVPGIILRRKYLRLTHV
jgi:hypothetical protein